MADDDGLRRDIGFGSLVGLIMGSIIGSGIFLSANAVFGMVDSAWLVMAAWAVGGLFTLCGALTLAELGAAYPESGGQSAFLRRGLGKPAAFLFSWTGFTVVQSGTVAAIAVAFAQIADQHFLHLPGEEAALGFLTIPGWGRGFLAVGIIWLLTAVNLFGVREGAWLNNGLTVVKVLALLGIGAAALLGSGDAGNFRAAAAGAGGTAFMLAVSETLFAYDGWAQGTFVAGEVKDARRTVPRAIVVGVLAVVAIYLLANYSYLRVLPLGSGTEQVAIDTVDSALGHGGLLVAAAILVSTFGATNSYVLASPRIFYDEARRGAFPPAFRRTNPRGVPHYGLWYQAVWASLLALTGTFEQLSLLVVFGLWLFYGLTAVAYFRLRRREPKAFSGFSSGMGPAPAIVFLLAAVAIVANFAVSDVRTAVLGLALVAAGAAVYWTNKTRRTD